MRKRGGSGNETRALASAFNFRQDVIIGVVRTWWKESGFCDR